MDNNFTEDDKTKFVEFLNSVAKYAKLELNTQELIAYFKLLNHMQSVILPKLNANILEVIRVVEPEKEEKPKDKKGK